METLVSVDHPYSRHWSESYKTDHSHAKPIHWLLPYCRSESISKGIGRHVNAAANNTLSSDGSDDEIDVESLDEVMSLYESGRSYDVQRARYHMNETERFTSHNANHGKISHADSRSETDWEEQINKSSWSMQQTRIFAKVVKILQDEKLSRLAFNGVNNEPIARRLSLDRSASCLRRILAEFSWDQKLTQWLHLLLINRLPSSMLASYLDLMQTLRSKVPALVERMIMQSTNDGGAAATERLGLLLKRPWEPLLTKQTQNHKQKLYESPIILLLPNSPYASSPTMTHRKRFWHSHLGQFGKVVAISSPEKTSGMTILTYLELLANSVRSRIKLYHNKHPGRPVVLAGWHTASTLCCHIALVEKVSAIICLGFPMQTLNGSRGTVDDVFCDLNTPALFVIGEEADSCDIDRMEDFRERLMTRCDSQMLAISGADDALRVSDKVKKAACVTQQMIDKMMLDYVGDFLSDTLLKTRVERWQLAKPILGKEYSTDFGRQAGDKKRGNSDDSLGATKRRRLSSATTAKISQVLSAPKGRDGAKTPVQGVTYNLQTGSISSLSTVPTVLGRTLSKTSEPTLMKHGKTGGKNKPNSRSITIDLTKDTPSQIKSGRSCSTPDPTLLPTGSQTEAAVATILGGTTEKSVTEPDTHDATATTTATTQSVNATDNTSAFTKITKSCVIAATTATSSIASPRSSPVLGSPAFGSSRMYDCKSKPLATFSNVRFNSTVIPKKPTEKVVTSETFSTINKHQWTGTIASSVRINVNKSPDARRKYPYLNQTSENASHVTSRSRKEERETMQATAFLEQLTSGIGNDNDQESTAIRSGLAEAVSCRRHSHDSRLVFGGTAKGRGAPLVSQSRSLVQKRRRTIHDERIQHSNYYQQKMQSSQPRKESVVRYVMTSDMSTMLSNAAAKAASTSGKILAKKPAQVARPKTAVVNTLTKPSILPVYAFAQQQPVTTPGVKAQPLPSSGDKSAAVTAGKIMKTSAAQDNSARKTSKVLMGQRLPVKFPGTIPGSSYTFVTIPALTGPIVPIGQKTQTGVKRNLNLPQRPKKVVKYSVVPRSNVVITATPINIAKKQEATVSSNTRSNTVVSLRDKALAKPVLSAQPRSEVKVSNSVTILTSPSVVLQKLSTDAVAEFKQEESKSSNDN